jgi:hypothetical protein
MSGPDSLPDVGARITAEARALRTVVSSQFSAEELTRLAGNRFSSIATEIFGLARKITQKPKRRAHVMNLRVGGSSRVI